MKSEDQYRLAVAWIVANDYTIVPGNSDWPPADVARWPTVRLVADVFGRSVREVADEVIERKRAFRPAR